MTCERASLTALALQLTDVLTSGLLCLVQLDDSGWLRETALRPALHVRRHPGQVRPGQACVAALSAAPSWPAPTLSLLRFSATCAPWAYPNTTAVVYGGETVASPHGYRLALLNSTDGG